VRPDAAAAGPEGAGAVTGATAGLGTASRGAAAVCATATAGLRHDRSTRYSCRQSTVAAATTASGGSTAVCATSGHRAAVSLQMEAQKQLQKATKLYLRRRMRQAVPPGKKRHSLLAVVSRRACGHAFRLSRTSPGHDETVSEHSLWKQGTL